MMRLVLLTGEDYEHCYVANRLADAFALVRIVVGQGAPRTRLDRLRYLRRRYGTAQLLSRGVLRGLAFVCRDRAARRQALFRVLGRADCERHRHEDLITRVLGLNTPTTRALIRDLNPDVLLVYGTAVIRDEILSLAARLALNMHTGMSPYYRGVDCAFWPLYRGELERLGATVHECTRDLDGGVIYKVGQLQLEPDDDRFSVFARAVKLGTDLYVQAVQELLDGRLQGRPQQLEWGREYRAAMKGWRHELVVRRRIRRGLIRDYVARHPPEAARDADRQGPFVVTP
jgi:methionyl-tRNA formyltransferase